MRRPYPCQAAVLAVLSVTWPLPAWAAAEAPPVVAWAWVAGLVAAVAIGAALVWLGEVRKRQLAEVRRLKARHREVALNSEALLESCSLARMLRNPSHGPDHQESRCRQHGEKVESLNAHLEALEAGLLRGRVKGSRQTLTELEAELAEAETTTHRLQGGLRLLKDENRAFERALSEARSLFRYLRESVDQPHVFGWTQDVAQGLDAVSAVLDESEGQWRDGDVIQALKRCHHVRKVMLSHRKALEARRASLNWLTVSAGAGDRLRAEAERLGRAGFRNLPEIPEERLETLCRQARLSLTAGALSHAADLQERLREELTTLHGELTGREELYQANQRDIAALGHELAALRQRLHTMFSGDAQRHYPKRLWVALRGDRDRAEATLRSLALRLTAIAQDNNKDAQRFAEARDGVRGLVTALREARELVDGCETGWRTLAREESRLQEHLRQLLGQVGEAHAHARQLGLGPDATVEPLLLDARRALAEEPVDLDQATKALQGAAEALEAFKVRIRAHGDRLHIAPMGRLGAITLFKQRSEVHGARPGAHEEPTSDS